MSSADSVTIWIEKLKEGDGVAAQQLWERYFAKMVHLARDKLTGVLTQMNDEEDVALSAFHSFCQAVDLGRFPKLNNRDDLWQILVMHTARKVITQRRYNDRQKRRSLTARSEMPIQDVVGAEPDPQFAAVMVEEFQYLLDLLEEDELRTIALQRLEGYTLEEISKNINLSESTIRRKIGVIRRCWDQARAESENS